MKINVQLAIQDIIYHLMMKINHNVKDVQILMINVKNVMEQRHRLNAYPAKVDIYLFIIIIMKLKNVIYLVKQVLVIYVKLAIV